MNKFLITNFDSIEELYEAAYEEVLDNGYTEESEGEDYFEELVQDAADNLYWDYVDEIQDAYDLEYWWRHNGWTLDRGYGGPNYKERVADNTDWDRIYDYIADVMEDNPSFGYPTVTRVQVNDLVIFWEDDEDDASEDDEDDASWYQEY